MEYKVYFLIDPKTGEVRYVGKTTKELSYRLMNGHMQDSSRTHKTNWIKSLKKEGLLPEVKLVKICENEDKCNYAEKFYIKLLGRADKSEGVLVNATDGGEGTTGRILSEETKRKISKGNKGKLLGRKLPEKVKEKMMKTRSNFSEKKKKEISKKISEATKGRKMSDETKEKLREINLGRTHSEEIRDKISKNGIGYKHSGSSSRFIGVSYISTHKLYRATVRFERESIVVGHFKKEIDAAIAYNKKAYELYGNEAKLNKIKDWESIDISKRFSSQFVGVTYRAKKDKWETSVWNEGKHRYVGTFDTEIEAARAYNNFVINNGLNKKLNEI
jgi:hypothetical protein